MRFIKYHEIENTYRTVFMEYVLHEGLTDGEFVVQEKAHGANLSFWFDGEQLQSAKRGGFIDEPFYNYEPVAEKHRGRMAQLFQTLKRKGYDFSALTVYGELIGGTYPHPDVEKDKTATKVQKGIFYTPHNEFYAIDAALDGQLLDVDAFNELMEQTGFLYAKTIFRGKFEECVNHPNRFQSQIPLWLGLPEIPDNICEGVVIKPVVPRFLSNNERLVLKSKNEKWQEKSRERDRSAKPAHQVSGEAVRLYEELLTLITEPRLHNVLSKTGPIAQTQFGMLLGEYAKDVLNEFQKDFGESFQALDKKDQKQITTKLNQNCAALIRKHFKNITDGTF